MSTGRHESVAGQIGERTEEWRFISSELGDGPADLVCLWADHCANPAEALQGVLAVLRLGSEEMTDRLEQANVHMMTVDMAAYMRAGREEPVKPRKK